MTSRQILAIQGRVTVSRPNVQCFEQFGLSTAATQVVVVPSDVVGGAEPEKTPQSTNKIIEFPYFPSNFALFPQVKDCMPFLTQVERAQANTTEYETTPLVVPNIEAAIEPALHIGKLFVIFIVYEYAVAKAIACGS